MSKTGDSRTPFSKLFGKCILNMYECPLNIFLILTVIFVLLSTPFAPAFGQQSQKDTMNKALNLYKQESYLPAAKLFSTIPTGEGLLFAGKSYFAAGYFMKARSFLIKALKTKVKNQNQKYDTEYTLALCDFELHNYGLSLDRLYKLIQNPQTGNVGNSAHIFYNGILGYLTLGQRLNAFHESNIPSVERDIVVSVFDKVDKGTASSLLKAIKRSFANTADSTIVQDLQAAVSTFPNFEQDRPSMIKVKAPNGISYSLGIALPKFQPNSDEYTVSQGLYDGILMAVENFNKSHNGQKVFIHYVNTLKDQDQPKDVMTELAWNQHADIVIGPLFSEMAATMAPMAEQYQIPILAPLANSDSLNIDNPYLYQANPTFAVRGKKMADFAVKQLHLDTLGVIVNSNSYGLNEAFAFRDEAEKLGAKVKYFFSEDFKTHKFDVAKYDQYFSGDTTLTDSLGSRDVDGVYMPFTGSEAPDLIQLVMTDFDANQSKVTILGSGEWASAGLQPSDISGFNIYYSGIDVPDTTRPAVKAFYSNYESRFNLNANRFSLIGYDCASFILNNLERIQNPSLLKMALKNSNEFIGLGSHYDFDGTHVNQAVEIFKLTSNGPAKVTITK